MNKEMETINAELSRHVHGRLNAVEVHLILNIIQKFDSHLIIFLILPGTEMVE